MLALASMLIMPMLFVVGVIVDEIWPKLGLRRRPANPVRPTLRHLMVLVAVIAVGGAFSRVFASSHGGVVDFFSLLNDVAFLVAAYLAGSWRRSSALDWIARTVLLGGVFCAFTGMVLLSGTHSLD